MKKRLSILSVLLFLTAGVTMGQTPINTQFPNPGMEVFQPGHTSNGDAVPYNWHSFNDADATGIYAASKDNHSNRVAGHTGNYAMQIYTKGIWVFVTIPANGSFSTGQTHVGSSDDSNTSNYVISKDGFRWSFVGLPDSVSFWTREGAVPQTLLSRFFYTPAAHSRILHITRHMQKEPT